MNRQILLSLLLALFCVSTVGCSNAGPKKYVLFGEPKAQKVELFEDYWSDYPFKPDDPSLPLRRGKGGVIRFFKKNSYTRSILVDGDLTVNVYKSVDEGVTLTQPDMQLVVTSEDLNKKHRKFEKETGYTYHVYLDLGEYDQPEEEITILSIFKDAKTGQVTLSKEIRTTAMGTTPLPEEEFSNGKSEAEKWARKKMGEDSENPIAELQKKYSTRNQERSEKEEAVGETRLRKTIELDDSQFEELDGERLVQSVSYMEAAESKHDAAMRRFQEENQSKSEYYRDLRRKQLEDYTNRRNAKTDEVSPLRDSRGMASSLSFQDASKTYSKFQEAQENNFKSTADLLTQRAKEEYNKDPDNTLRTQPPKAIGYAHAEDEEYKRPVKSKKSGIPEGFVPAKQQSIVDMDALHPSEMDKLDDFQPDAHAVPTEVYTRQR